MSQLYGYPCPDDSQLPAVVEVAEDGADAVVFWHRCGAGADPVLARLAVSPARWQITSREPLSIMPSILCKSCGLHGYWTEGVWRAV